MGGLGPHAVEKKKMVAAGTLGKFGKPNEKTPDDWKEKCPDLSATPTVIKIAKEEPTSIDHVIMPGGAKVKTESPVKKEKKEKKKKKKKKKDKTPEVKSESASAPV